MAQYPYLPLFVDAFSAATAHLTDAECGRYLRILMLMWGTPGCRVPNDAAWLAKRLNRSVDSYQAEILPVIEEFCRSDGNHITQKRLSKEFERLRKTSKKQSGIAKQRWDKRKDISQDNATRHASGSASTPTHTPTPTKKERADPPAGAKVYAFERKTIKLNQKDFGDWKAMCPDLSLEVELDGMDDWATGKGAQWFFAVRNLLRTKQREAFQRKNQPPPQANDGTGRALHEDEHGQAKLPPGGW